MRDVLTRQLIAPAAAFLLIFNASNASAEGLRERTIAERLQAAKLMQAALAARSATPEEWRKLDDEYAALVARNPRDATTHNAHAEYLWEIGEQSRAVKEWEVADQIDPANATVLEHLGASTLALGETRKAAQYYSRAVSSNPANAECHFALANVCFLFRHELLDTAHPDAGSLLTAALTHFAEAARLAPTNREYARAYAETYYSVPEPDWTAALAAWEKFRRLSPQQDFALLHLARVNLKLGQIDAARSCLSQIQSTDYQTLKTRLEAQIDSRSETSRKEPSLRP